MELSLGLRQPQHAPGPGGGGPRHRGGGGGGLLARAAAQPLVDGGHPASHLLAGLGSQVAAAAPPAQHQHVGGAAGAGVPGLGLATLPHLHRGATSIGTIYY